MLNPQQKLVLPHFCRLLGSSSEGGSSDAELLERFLACCDATAFALLVQRHGPAVLGVCRRILRDAHDAEDAFQATFLVLARKARSISRRASLASWLYGVAYRVALKARADAACRRKHERQAGSRHEVAPQDAGIDEETRSIVDDEVNRLPAKYREPVVLCYFEGRTYQEAAQLLGWPSGTAAARLARARKLLRRRLERRGLALASGALAVYLAEGAVCASEVSVLIDATARAAVYWLVQATSPGVSTQVIALTEGVLKAMFMRRLKALAGLVLVVGMTLGGTAALWRFAGTTPVSAADPLATEDGPGRAAAVLPAPPHAVAPPASEAKGPLQSRIGIINMTRVIKGSRKFQKVQLDLRARTTLEQHKLEVLKKESQQRQAEANDPGTPADRRDEVIRKIKQLQREIEDEREIAQARITRLNGESVVAIYKEIEEAANRVAKLKGLELVLFYNDAVSEADFYSPANLERKLSQPGALMPLIVRPGMDITDSVLEVFNGKQAGEEKLNQ